MFGNKFRKILHSTLTKKNIRKPQTVYRSQTYDHRQFIYYIYEDLRSWEGGGALK